MRLLHFILKFMLIVIVLDLYLNIKNVEFKLYT